jgi:peptidyl-prolyl cis-trans isomerase D
MLRFFRAFAKSWFGPVIMGLLVLAFGILGGGSMRDVLRGKIENAVVEAGSHTVTEQQFFKRFSNIKQNYEEQEQQPYPLEEAVKANVDEDMVNQLAQEQSYFEMLSRAGVRPSDDVLVSETVKAAQSGQDPELARVFDSVTGKFRPDLLAKLLEAAGLTQEQFDLDRRDNLANEEFGSAVSDGFRTPRIYSAVQVALSTEARDVTFFVIPETSVTPPPPPTDAQLTALIVQNRDRLMLPERRMLTIVRFSAKALAPTMTVDPAAVQQQFEARKDTYGKPELRSLVEIPLNDPSTAAQVAQRLAAGQDPNAVAKSVGVAAVAYTDQPQSAIADSKAGAAAFAMAAGQVSGPVQGDFKTVILKVTKITPGQAPSLEAARPQIEADLRQMAAMEKVADMSQKFEDARDSGDSLAVAAAKVGASTLSVGPLTADGKDLATGQVNPALGEKLLKTAFGLSANGDSDVEQDADKGEYYAVHVDQIQPPRVATLADPGVRPAITQLYAQQIVIAELQKKAAAATAAIGKGQTFEAAAAAAGGHVTHQVGLERVNAQQYQQTLGDELLAQIFQSKVNTPFVAGSGPLHGLVVGRVDAIRPADPKDIAAMIDPLRQRADQTYLQGIAATTRAAAVKLVKPTTDLALADNAMGVDPATLAKLRPKTPAKGSGPAQ